MGLAGPRGGEESMQVKFWGVRGSIPSPGPHTTKYGGNTSCIQVTAGSEVLILDAGTGIRELGLQLMATRRPVRAHVLLTHTHWDHIQGLPFFAPIYTPDCDITIYGPGGLEKSLEEAVMVQMQRLWFPVRRSELQGKIRFKELGPDRFRIGEVEVSTHWMNHPVLTLAYKIAHAGKRVVYTGDNEPYNFFHVYSPGTQGTIKISASPAEMERRTKKNIEFFAGADLLIHDCQYTDEEYQKKVGWGHSPISHVCSMAAQARVRRLAIFHHEPNHSDADLEQMAETAKTRLAALDGSIEVILAREGLQVEL